MANILISSLWNANCYINGNDLLGRAAEAEVPQPKRLLQEYKGLGMAARVEIPVGWDKLEATFKWSSFDLQILTNVAASTSLTAMSVLGDVQVFSAAGEITEIPAIYNLTAIVHDPGQLMMKAQQNTEFSTKMTVWHCELYLAGIQLYLFDAMSNQFIVNGIDQLAVYRAFVGG
jgi:P2 family phage contractile tail tube protein